MKPIRSLGITGSLCSARRRLGWSPPARSERRPGRRSEPRRNHLTNNGSRDIGCSVGRGSPDPAPVATGGLPGSASDRRRIEETFGPSGVEVGRPRHNCGPSGVEVGRLDTTVVPPVSRSGDLDTTVEQHWPGAAAGPLRPEPLEIHVSWPRIGMTAGALRWLVSTDLNPADLYPSVEKCLPVEAPWCMAAGPRSSSWTTRRLRRLRISMRVGASTTPRNRRRLIT